MRKGTKPKQPRKPNTNRARAESTEHRLDKRLREYADYDPEAFKAGKRLPNVFHCGRINGKACCTVFVDWDAVVEYLSYFLKRTAQHYEGWNSLTDDQVRRVTESIEPRSKAALAYLQPRLPERSKQSFDRLCFEATGVVIQRWSRGIASSAGLENLSLAKIVDTMIDIERREIKKDLEIRSGPIPRFRNDTDYRQHLETWAASIIKRDEKLTLGSIAEEAGKGATETLDEGTIKGWNKEYKLKWKPFKMTMFEKYRMVER